MHFVTAKIDSPMGFEFEHDAAAEVTLGYRIDIEGHPFGFSLESVDSFALAIDGEEYELTPAAQEKFVRRWLNTDTGLVFLRRTCERHWQDHGCHERHAARV